MFKFFAIVLSTARGPLRFSDMWFFHSLPSLRERMSASQDQNRCLPCTNSVGKASDKGLSCLLLCLTSIKRIFILSARRTYLGENLNPEIESQSIAKYTVHSLKHSLHCVFVFIYIDTYIHIKSTTAISIVSVLLAVMMAMQTGTRLLTAVI